MGMSYNWKLALRKALIQAGLALFTQFASIQRWPTFNELWVPLVIAGLAFFTVLEKEEYNPVHDKTLKLKKVKRFIAESLMG